MDRHDETKYICVSRKYGRPSGFMRLDNFQKLHLAFSIRSNSINLCSNPVTFHQYIGAMSQPIGFPGLCTKLHHAGK